VDGHGGDRTASVPPVPNEVVELTKAQLSTSVRHAAVRSARQGWRQGVSVRPTRSRSLLGTCGVENFDNNTTVESSRTNFHVGVATLCGPSLARVPG